MEQYTPMMQQYLEVKKNYQDALVFYRLGDFYEMFFEDAKIASCELDLVLTGRNAGVKDRVPMCGVPFHAVTGYIQRLVQKGYKVAIVEQMEDPALAKGLVKRDVIKVVTPGTVIDELFDERSSIYLAAVVDYQYGLALSICEMSTGETTVTHIPRNILHLQQTLLKNNIREIVVKEGFDEKFIRGVRDLSAVAISYCGEDQIGEDYLPLCEEVTEAPQREAYGVMLNYLIETQKRMMHHLQTVEIENENDVLYMDFSTQQNLELVVPLRTQSKSETLWSFLDHCQSAMGSRLLKKWIERPLVDKKKILFRQDRLDYLMKNYLVREDLKDKLNQIYDMERLIARVAYGSANAIDCQRLQKTLSQVPDILALFQDAPVFQEYQDIDCCLPLTELLDGAFVENPPVSVKEGGMFAEGFSEQLDEYRSAQKDGKNWILQQENYERERTGIKTLKIGYNRVFGYYIEVSKGAAAQVKEEYGYVRKQTLTNAERYITSELKEKEDAILHAEERSIRLETELFANLLEQIRSYLPKLQKLALMLANMDVYYALSSISADNGYVRPVFTEDPLKIEEGRHPILEKISTNRYVSNSLAMDKEKQILIITGPNMGGKSTYMRQVALIILMAQIGCFVPAKKCEMPIFDKIFTRIGASDDILSGQSTFMVEMTEANNALSQATEHSLILFDEIGRGTSTYDGMALAQAMIEYIAVCIHAKTLFSTHYHELTSLDESLPVVKNVHVEVHEDNGHVTFMYRVKQGKADRSYGINVARLAKLPDAVLDRASDLLAEYESKKRVVQQSLGIVEMVKAPVKEQGVLDKLEMVDPNQLSPLQALQMIMDLKLELSVAQKA